MAKQIVKVQDIDIKYFDKNGDEYISLTDIAKQSSDEPRFIIRNWLNNTNTVRYLYEWEQFHFPNENRAHLRTVLEFATDNRSSISPKKWISFIDAKGITSKGGRNGGTYAHRDIALNFCYWLSPTFQIYLIKEFQRLKAEEARKLGLQWTVRREIAKSNYRILTETIKNNLIPERVKDNQGYTYASEADILNVALFGITAKDWRSQNPNAKGNIRDFATIEQLLILANLETHNAEFIKEGLSQDERLDRLNQIAIEQSKIIAQYSNLNQLKSKE